MQGLGSRAWGLGKQEDSKVELDLDLDNLVDRDGP